MSGIEILASDSYGVYIPQKFVENFNWSGIDMADMETVMAGPEDEYYWDAWDNVIRDAFHMDKDGNSWRLYQDGDLFAICDKLMTDEEYYNLFGEERI